MKPLKIAVSKGYLLTEAIKQMEAIGIHFDESDIQSRKLSIQDSTKTVELLLIRPWDVPEYVEHGAADIGVAGQDVLYEKQNNVLQLKSLGFGHCQLVLAGPQDISSEDLKHNTTIATKYPNATERYCHQLGLKVNIIKLYGAIELAPLTGLSDIICDLTATGSTLKENNLHIIETIFKSEAILIANHSHFRYHYTRITDLIEQWS